MRWTLPAQSPPTADWKRACWPSSPPFTQLREVARHLHGTGILVGAQDCHESANGAFTGSVSARMIADAGATGVIVGHSERRQGLGESDALVLAKVQAAILAGLATVVVCIGETEAEHAESRTLEVLHAQIEGSLPSDVDTGRLVLAYEPVWAIGTGRMPTAAEVGHVHGQLRAKLVDYLDGDGAAVPILYGGFGQEFERGDDAGDRGCGWRPGRRGQP